MSSFNYLSSEYDDKKGKEQYLDNANIDDTTIEDKIPETQRNNYYHQQREVEELKQKIKTKFIRARKPYPESSPYRRAFSDETEYPDPKGSNRDFRIDNFFADSLPVYHMEHKEKKTPLSELPVFHNSYHHPNEVVETEELLSFQVAPQVENYSIPPPPSVHSYLEQQQKQQKQCHSIDSFCCFPYWTALFTSICIIIILILSLLGKMLVIL